MSDPKPIGPGQFAAFVAEMGMLVCLWVTGLSWGDSWLSSLAFALLLVTAAALVWGRWCAPRSVNRLPRIPRWILKVALVSATLAMVILVGPSPTWVVVGLATWALMVGTLPWDTHDVG